MTDVVCHHPRKHVVAADDNQLIFCTRDCRIEKIARQKSRICVKNRENDDGKLVSLRFMYGDGISQVKLRKQFRRISGDTAVVKGKGDRLRRGVDCRNGRGIAVKHAKACLARVRPLANYIVVVAHLHHTVADAQDAVAHTQLGFLRRRRIERLLQAAIQVDGTCLLFF